MFNYFNHGLLHTVDVGYSDNFVGFEVPQSMTFHTNLIGYSDILDVQHWRQVWVPGGGGGPPRCGPWGTVVLGNGAVEEAVV